MSTNQYLRQADDCAAGVLHGRFRRVTRLDDSEETANLVAKAVARAKRGDREALRYLYVRYADNIYGYVASIVRDDHEAEDVTQHVFAKLMTTLPKYEQRDVPFSAWILRVARNVALDHVRQRRAVPCEEVREADPHGNEEFSDRSLMLRDALASLPDDQREVLMLRHVAGLSPGEIAGRMGKTEPSVHGLHHRGRGALRTALVERDSAPTVLARAAA